MVCRFALLSLAFLLTACDSGDATQSGSGGPDASITVGRFDGEMVSTTEDISLRVFLDEDREESDGTVIAGVGGALYLGTSPKLVSSTLGRQSGDEIRFITTLRSGGTASFSGTVLDEGRTLFGVLAGETESGTFGPSGIVLRWQDLNYGT